MYRKIANTFCKVLIYMIAFVVAVLMGIMLIHILKESIPALREVGIKMFLPSSEWRPVSATPQYGLLPAVTGTLYVSGLAVLFAMILGVACACFLTFFMPKKLASVCLAFIDLVAGIPSVIFGFIGLTVLVKAFVKYLKMAAGQCVLVAGIVLGIMLLPYVVSTCQESLVNAKRTYEKSGLALGLSREYVLIKVILPAIRPGIVASAMMAFGRALGETMAVMMVIGNSAIFPKLLGRGQTLPALTALEMLVVVILAGQLLKRRFAEHEK